MINVKSVILPKGGISYNPSMQDHIKVLKEVAQVEEAGVLEELKNLKKVHPLEYAEQNEEDDENQNEKSEDNSSYGDEDSSDGEEADLDAPLGVGKPVDRNNVKTQAQRNQKVLNRMKNQQKQKELQRIQLHKDADRVDNLVKQALNEENRIKNKMEKRERDEHNENEKQSKVGVVSNPKKIGRFKYKMRKPDFQLESDLAGNMR